MGGRKTPVRGRGESSERPADRPASRSAAGDRPARDGSAPGGPPPNRKLRDRSATPATKGPRDGAKGGATTRGGATRGGAKSGATGAGPKGKSEPARETRSTRTPRAPKPEPMRLQRALARAGIASRRKAEELIAAGRVTVNGHVAVVGQSVDLSTDRVLVDGVPLAAPAAATWLVLHKPLGVMTTRDDPEGRETVFSLVPDVPGLTYVGRLDFMTEGVLLLTTDGEAAHRLTHPSSEVERTYVATVRGPAVAAAAQAVRGLELEDGWVQAEASEARPLGNRLWELELVLTEGRTREVRRLCEALGLVVERLVRTRFGPVRLGALRPGEHRVLLSRERLVIDGIVRAGRRRGGRPRS